MKGRPLYQRLADHLLREVSQGRLRPGDRLPTEEEMVRAHRVSRITVRQALEVLRHRGLVERFAGRGSFVCRPPGTSVWTLETVDDVAREGSQTDVKVCSWQVVRPPPPVGRQLEASGRPVYRLRGVRSTGGTPLYYEEIYLSLEVGRRLRRDDLDRTTVLDLVQGKLGIPLVRGLEEISAGVADAALARRLRLPLNAPALILELTYFSADDTPIVHVKAWCRADRFRLRNELRRGSSRVDPEAIMSDQRGARR